MPRARDERKQAAIQAAVLSAAKAIAEPAAFRDQGLSSRTIHALVNCGIDTPERLRSITEAQLRAIPAIGKVSMQEILRYRGALPRVINVANPSLAYCRP